jgi:hypothetical protein
MLGHPDGVSSEQVILEKGFGAPELDILHTAIHNSLRVELVTKTAGAGKQVFSGRLIRSIILNKTK